MQLIRLHVGSMDGMDGWRARYLPLFMCGVGAGPAVEGDSLGKSPSPDSFCITQHMDRQTDSHATKVSQEHSVHLCCVVCTDGPFRVGLSSCGDEYGPVGPALRAPIAIVEG